MVIVEGTTNGFRITNGLIGTTNPPGAVVPLRNGDISYAMKWPGVARNVAVSQKAFGFWRLKKS